MGLQLNLKSARRQGGSKPLQKVPSIKARRGALSATALDRATVYAHLKFRQFLNLTYITPLLSMYGLCLEPLSSPARDSCDPLMEIAVCGLGL